MGKIGIWELLVILVIVLLIFGPKALPKLGAPAKSPGDPTYKVGLDDGFHGTVTADKDMADEGETVRLTVTPSEGYIIESVSVYAIDLHSTVPVTYSEGNYVFTMPASEVQASATFRPAPTTYTFKGVSFALAGLNQLTSGSDAGKWMPATPIDWTKILVSIDPGADSAIPDSALVEAHFDFLYTDAACTTILTGDMQDTGTYYLRLVVNNKNAENHSIDYSSLAAEHCSASVAGYTTSFVSAAATSFAGKDAVEVVFSVTRNSTTAAPYTITVNGGKAYKAGGVEITSAAEAQFLRHEYFSSRWYGPTIISIQYHKAYDLSHQRQ